jgi:4-alpha-glucanotransferase
MSRRCPGGHGIGDLGNSAYELVEFLAQSRQKIWQVLPLGPTGYGDSPYQLFSAFAGNPLLIDLYTLRERGLLSSQDLDSASGLPDDHVEYGRVIHLKQDLIRRAARTFLADGTHADHVAFDIFAVTTPIGWMTIRFLWRARESTRMRSGQIGIWEFDRGTHRLSENGDRNYRPR